MSAGNLDAFMQNRSNALRKTFWSFWLASPWRIIAIQLITGLVLGAVLALASQNWRWGWSLVYGSWCVSVPAIVFVHGAFGRRGSAQVVLLRFYFWQGIKLIMAAVMLALAPKVILDLNWWALLAGLVITMKMYAVLAMGNGFYLRQKRLNRVD